MKRIILSLLAVTSFSAAHASPTTSIQTNRFANETPRFSITAAPLAPLSLSLIGTVAYALNDSTAITFPFRFGRTIGVDLPTFSTDPARKNETIAVGAFGWAAELGIGARFFLSNKVFKDGWFINPDMVVAYNYNSNAQSNNITLRPRVYGGYTWVWDSGFTLNLGLGIAMNYDVVGKSNEVRVADVLRQMNNPNAKPSSAFDIGPTGELSIGYAF